MFLTMINDDLSRFEEMYNNHKLSTENYFTPLQLLCMRIEMVAEDVEVDWARYGLNPEDLQEAEINYREIDNDMCNPLRDAEDAFKFLLTTVNVSSTLRPDPVNRKY